MTFRFKHPVLKIEVEVARDVGGEYAVTPRFMEEEVVRLCEDMLENTGEYFPSSEAATRWLAEALGGELAKGESVPEAESEEGRIY